MELTPSSPRICDTHRKMDNYKTATVSALLFFCHLVSYLCARPLNSLRCMKNWNPSF